MKKAIVSTILFVLIFILGSCGGMQVLHGRYVASNYEERMNSVLDSLISGNEESLKSMFSERVVVESMTLDEDTEALFEFFQGDIKSVTRMGASVSSDSDTDYFIQTSNAWYKVETDVQNYLFIFIDNQINTEKAEMVGLYTLRVILEEEKDELFKSWEDIKIPGIFCSSLE